MTVVNGKRIRSRKAYHQRTLINVSLFVFWLMGVLIVYYLFLPMDRHTGKDLIRKNITTNRRKLSAATPMNRVVEDFEEKSPVTLPEIIDYLQDWIAQLHHHLLHVEHPSDPESIWETFRNLTIQTLYPWDLDYLTRMPVRRKDNTIFLSVASYRDQHCPNTLHQAYQKAKYPELLYVGLVQQNCLEACRTGIQEDGFAHPTDPDLDCYDTFCRTEIGKEHCNAGRLRVLRMQEPDSLGPYMARYLASKLWYGEEWYMQIDAHMTFADNWDMISIQGLQIAPSEKPVLSHYPPAHTFDLKDFESTPASRICGPIFTPQTIRLEGSQIWDSQKLDIPRFAPVVGGGYLVARSSILKEVPFDPFLPWIFMGEEIILSSRLWTAGYDLFSPAQAVLGHIYNRQHQPRFWESVQRVLTPGVYDEIQEIVLERIKFQLGFPESARDMISDTTLTAINHYTMGTARSLDAYLKLIGMNTTTKEVTRNEWCEHGVPPPGFKKFDHLYQFQKHQHLRSSGNCHVIPLVRLMFVCAAAFLIMRIF